jgi:hypothetical protein
MKPHRASSYRMRLSSLCVVTPPGVTRFRNSSIIVLQSVSRRAPLLLDNSTVCQSCLIPAPVILSDVASIVACAPFQMILNGHLRLRLARGYCQRVALSSARQRGGCRCTPDLLLR